MISLVKVMGFFKKLQALDLQTATLQDVRPDLPIAIAAPTQNTASTRQHPAALPPPVPTLHQKRWSKLLHLKGVAFKQSPNYASQPPQNHPEGQHGSHHKVVGSRHRFRSCPSSRNHSSQGKRLRFQRC